MKFRSADCGLRIEKRNLGSPIKERPIQNPKSKIQNFIAPEVICGVEDGWSGMRRFSLDAAQDGRAVLVVIRDAVEPEVLELITTPPGMRLMAVERFWFRARLIWEMVNAAARGRLRQVVVSRARTRRDLSPIAWLLGARVAQLVDTEQGYRLHSPTNEQEH